MTADELYPGYDPMIDEPWPVTCEGHPTAEQMEASARREREQIPYYELLWVLNEWTWREALAQAKVEIWAREPWVRQWPELFS